MDETRRAAATVVYKAPRLQVPCRPAENFVLLCTRFRERDWVRNFATVLSRQRGPLAEPPPRPRTDPQDGPSAGPGQNRPLAQRPTVGEGRPGAGVARPSDPAHGPHVGQVRLAPGAAVEGLGHVVRAVGPEVVVALAHKVPRRVATPPPPPPPPPPVRPTSTESPPYTRDRDGLVYDPRTGLGPKDTSGREGTLPESDLSPAPRHPHGRHGAVSADGSLWSPCEPGGTRGRRVLKGIPVRYGEKTEGTRSGRTGRHSPASGPSHPAGTEAPSRRG